MTKNIKKCNKSKYLKDAYSVWGRRISICSFLCSEVGLEVSKAFVRVDDCCAYVSSR